MKSNRYIRQTLLPEIGENGQRKLAKAKVCIIGCGGLGSIAAPYLAGAGVGHIILIDGDTPELSNLHRQVFFTGNEKESKAEALATHILKTNPDIKVDVVSKMLDKENIATIINDVTLVLECTDDMMCKYLVNDWCHLKNIPLIYGAIFKFEGYISLFKNETENDIHLRDIFPEPDLTIPTCSEVGVMNTIAGLIGMLQANEALKYLLEINENLSGQLLTYNALTNDQLKLKLKKSWVGDVQKLLESETYTISNCKTVPEITIDQIMSKINEYELISILEIDEHQSITDNCKHQPLSTFDIQKWSLGEKPKIYYCMSGKRSATLVHRILEENATANVYSLKGGLMALEKNK